jgi:hypothetical protein
VKPKCRYCGKAMQLNPAMSTENIQQYVCACQGYIYHVNVAPWKSPLELRHPKNK